MHCVHACVVRTCIPSSAQLFPSPFYLKTCLRTQACASGCLRSCFFGYIRLWKRVPFNGVFLFVHVVLKRVMGSCIVYAGHECGNVSVSVVFALCASFRGPRFVYRVVRWKKGWLSAKKTRSSINQRIGPQNRPNRVEVQSKTRETTREREKQTPSMSELWRLPTWANLRLCHGVFSFKAYCSFIRPWFKVEQIITWPWNVLWRRRVGFSFCKPLVSPTSRHRLKYSEDFQAE